MLFKLFSSLRRHNVFINRHFRCIQQQYKNASELKESINETTDEPIKFSTSKAGQWKAAYSTSGEGYYSMPRIQPLVVVLSLTAFMVYFCILREENDLDDWLREIESSVPIQLEEAQLQIEIQSDKKKGIDVSWKESRLKELRKQRENIKSSS